MATNTATDTQHLLSDDEMVSFVINGYHVVEPELPSGFNRSVYDELEELPSNPGDGIYDAVPKLKQVYESPEVRGALTSLLGAGYGMFPHRHCHRNAPGTPSQQIHQDNLNDLRIRDGQVRAPDKVELLLAMYYPQDVASNMGPTVLLPGTHMLKAMPDRMASQGNFKEQYTATVNAGSVVILHYDIWHAGSANTSSTVRYMLKFLFQRENLPDVPSWDHDSSNDARIRERLESASPMALQRSLNAKQRHMRLRMWNYLSGAETLEMGYRDKWRGPWR